MGGHHSKLFTKFLNDFPEVFLEVQSTTRHVDFLADGVDVALRVGPIDDENLIARQIHSDRSIVVASPSYLERYGRPQDASCLSQYDCIVGFSGGWTPSNEWPLLGGGTVTVSGRLSANEIDLIREAALDGLGLALVASAIVAEDVLAGRLIPILQDEVGAVLPVSLVYADREFVDPKVRQFVDRAAVVIAREMPKPLDSV